MRIDYELLWKELTAPVCLRIASRASLYSWADAYACSVRSVCIPEAKNKSQEMLKELLKDKVLQVDGTDARIPFD